MTHSVQQFTDEALEDARGGSNIGLSNAVDYFLKLPTPELRQRAHTMAFVIVNTSAENYSGAVYRAVNEILALDNSDDETQTEKDLYSSSKYL